MGEQPRLLGMQLFEDLLERVERARLRVAHLFGQPVAPAGDVQQYGLKVGRSGAGRPFLGLESQSNYPLGSHRMEKSAEPAPG
jgi:hypothetical protein